MPRPSLRRAVRNPKPGAAGCGCPRPKALRFAPPPGSSPFGDGTYSGNIVQNGDVLQPQPYLLNGELLQDCIVVTGAATVAPDQGTGAAAFMCRNLVVNGGSLAPSANCKGLLGFVCGSIRFVNGGRAHIDRLGKAGNFGNLTAYDLAPSSLKGKLSAARLALCTVLGEGADGGAGAWVSNGNTAGATGAAAGAMQTGGGGGGSAHTSSINTGGKGGRGGPCCGGCGGGSVSSLASGAVGNAAPAYGGPAAEPFSDNASWAVGGSSGDPCTANTAGGVVFSVYPPGAGGGLLMLFSPAISIASGSVVSADGSTGGATGGTYQCFGAASGGGCVVMATRPGGLANSGTIRANGGPALTGANRADGSAGGPGSVNIFTI